MKPINITAEFKKFLLGQPQPPAEGSKQFGLARQQFVNQQLASREWVEVHGYFYNRKEWDA